MSEKFYYYFRRMMKVYLLAMLGLVILMFAVSQEWLGELPSIEYIKDPQKQVASVIYTEDYEEMGKLYYENRTVLNYNQISASTIQALIATEDIRFYDHAGIDVIGMVSALARTATGRKSGASTITQQLAKNLFHSTGRKNIFLRLLQKTKEWYIAIELERNFSKQEILSLYLNTVPFLHNSFGIREAAQTYFSKEPINLSLDESAILIGMLKGPGIYNPKSHPDNALKRRNVVIDQMLKAGFINAKTADGVKDLPIALKYKLTSPSTGLAPYLREEIRTELDELLSNYSKADGTPYNIYTDGLKVYTTINSQMQKYAEESVNEHMRWLQGQFLREWKDKDKKILQVGLCAMDPSTGKIKAWVGGIDFNHFKLDHVRQSTKRQVGSTIKPLLYAAALENGMTPCSPIEYVRPNISGHESWNPKGTKFFEEGSLVTLRDGLQVSDNRIAAQLIKRLGPSTLIEKAEQLGIQADFENVPAICLGTTDISVYEMIGAYSPFMNSGIYSKPYYIDRIEDKNGNIIYENKHSDIIDSDMGWGRRPFDNLCFDRTRTRCKQRSADLGKIV
jgi:penicillin-binding protein 1A